ncbi:MAG TPA: radical SAM protein [Gammaproteobacteria bacterium]|nr:radical SAM protein [Gammaproteobacteria bacterium]
MNARDYLTHLLPKTLAFKLVWWGLKQPVMPIILTYSITAACQSKCKTCNIGIKWLEDPSRSHTDLTLEEIERVFANIGPVYLFNISGGEPFLRRDIAEIVRLACQYLRPRIIHIPTNALMPRKIQERARQCLEVIQAHDPRIQFSIKPSIDGVGEIHDEVRGVKGNFERLKQTIGLLKELEEEYPNFHLELGTVISNFNKEHLSGIEDYVHSLGVQSYRNEIAEQRAEFFNIGEDITPDAETYAALIEEFSAKIRRNMKKKRRLARLTESMRLVYYELVVKILRENRQIIPCLGGISNVHINHDGEVWPCCVLGYDKPMGSLRTFDYDFRSLWRSHQAASVRKYIKEGNCACPLANQWYSNILASPKYMTKTVVNLLKYG